MPREGIPSGASAGKRGAFQVLLGPGTDSNVFLASTIIVATAAYFAAASRSSRAAADETQASATTPCELLASRTSSILLQRASRIVFIEFIKSTRQFCADCSLSMLRSEHFRTSPSSACVKAPSVERASVRIKTPLEDADRHKPAKSPLELAIHPTARSRK